MLSKTVFISFAYLVIFSSSLSAYYRSTSQSRQNYLNLQSPQHSLPHSHHQPEQIGIKNDDSLEDNLEVGSVDEGSVVASEEGDGGGHLGDIPEPVGDVELSPDWLPLLSATLPGRLGHLRGPDPAGGHRVHSEQPFRLTFNSREPVPDLERSKVQGHVLGEDVDGTFRGGVGPSVGLSLVGGDAADVDHAAVLCDGEGLDVVGQRLHHEAVPGDIDPIRRII